MLRLGFPSVRSAGRVPPFRLRPGLVPPSLSRHACPSLPAPLGVSLPSRCAGRVPPSLPRRACPSLPALSGVFLRSRSAGRVPPSLPHRACPSVPAPPGVFLLADIGEYSISVSPSNNLLLLFAELHPCILACPVQPGGAVSAGDTTELLRPLLVPGAALVSGEGGKWVSFW